MRTEFTDEEILIMRVRDDSLEITDYLSELMEEKYEAAVIMNAFAQLFLRFLDCNGDDNLIQWVLNEMKKRGMIDGLSKI